MLLDPKRKRIGGVEALFLMKVLYRVFRENARKSIEFLQHVAMKNSDVRHEKCVYMTNYEYTELDGDV